MDGTWRDAPMSKVLRSVRHTYVHTHLDVHRLSILKKNKKIRVTMNLTVVLNELI